MMHYSSPKYIHAVRELVGGRVAGPKNGPLSALKFYDGQTLPTEEQIQAKIAELTAAEPMRLLRIERNLKLTETDWRMVEDYPMANKLDWKTYRQTLRDLPATAEPKLDDVGNLTNVDWPEVPE